MRRFLMPALLGLLVGACGILGPDEKRVVGQLASNPQRFPQHFVVPDSVLVREAFTVVVTTVGHQCYRRGETEVRIQDNVATITPYDYVDIRHDVCLLAPSHFTHEATVRFMEVGEALVVIRGRARNASHQIIEVTGTWPLRVY